MIPADIEAVHSVIADDSPVKIPHGCRDGILSMISEAPGRKAFGVEIFKTPFERAACVMQEIIRLHPFRDGNKRTGLLVACVMLEIDGIKIKLPSYASNLAREVAEKHDVDHISYLAKWFKDCTC